MRSVLLVTLSWIISGVTFSYFSKDYEEGFEAGRLYVRNCMLLQTDSILGCSSIGYIPDTISAKPELKNGGSYEIKGKKN
jgi:hypothetical protein